VFGGIILLIIGVRFVFKGVESIADLRGNPGHIAGSIAMPIMIGPGTVSASILAGNKLSQSFAVLSIWIAVLIAILVVICLKAIHDYIKPKNEKLIDRYIEIMGRITALVVGTYSIEMIMQGLQNWLKC
jgi:small neutral amino acid transporter SnatA (MarC family)